MNPGTQVMVDHHYNKVTDLINQIREETVALGLIAFSDTESPVLNQVSGVSSAIQDDLWRIQQALKGINEGIKLRQLAPTNSTQGVAI